MSHNFSPFNFWGLFSAAMGALIAAYFTVTPTRANWVRITVGIFALWILANILYKLIPFENTDENPAPSWSEPKRSPTANDAIRITAGIVVISMVGFLSYKLVPFEYASQNQFQTSIEAKPAPTPAVIPSPTTKPLCAKDLVECQTTVKRDFDSADAWQKLGDAYAAFGRLSQADGAYGVSCLTDGGSGNTGHRPLSKVSICKIVCTMGIRDDEWVGKLGIAAHDIGEESVAQALFVMASSFDPGDPKWPAKIDPVGGLRVRRGPAWKWSEQDGGFGKVGTLTGRRDSEGWVEVKWDNADPNAAPGWYRWDEENCKCCDLSTVSDYCQ